MQDEQDPGIIQTLLLGHFSLAGPECIGSPCARWTNFVALREVA